MSFIFLFYLDAHTCTQNTWNLVLAARSSYEFLQFLIFFFFFLAFFPHSDDWSLLFLVNEWKNKSHTKCSFWINTLWQKPSIRTIPKIHKPTLVAASEQNENNGLKFILGSLGVWTATHILCMRIQAQFWILQIKNYFANDLAKGNENSEHYWDWRMQRKTSARKVNTYT